MTGTFLAGTVALVLWMRPAPARRWNWGRALRCPTVCYEPGGTEVIFTKAAWCRKP